jgi:integrase
MASALITTRTTKSGARYVVRYRLGGRAYPLEHGGSFKTLKEARARRDLVAGELAAGRSPAGALQGLLAAPTATVTFAAWAERYRASRVDLKTTNLLASHVNGMLPAFGDRSPDAIGWADVQEWIAGLTLSPASVKQYLVTLRAVLDFAGVDPNPARDPRVKLPRVESTIVEPPSAAEVDVIIANVPPRWRLPLRVLEQTGMRVGEATSLEWGDVDEAACRFRVKAGKTAAARRWVAVPEWLMVEVAATVPREDRTAERRVFPGFSPDSARIAMARACITAGIAHRHPHDLRHRYASVKIAEGVPVTTLAAQLGHTKKSLTLDVYSHVLLDEGR